MTPATATRWTAEGDLHLVDHAGTVVRRIRGPMSRVMTVGEGAIFAALVLADRTDMFNVKDYGAIGSGLVDDQPAIQSALDACDVAGGGTVHVPAGVYRVDAPIQIGDDTTLDMAPNAVIRRNFATGAEGGSAWATIRNKNQVLAGNTGIVIRGGRVDSGTNSDNIGKAVALRGVVQSQIRDLRVGQVWGDWCFNISGQYITVEGVHIDTGEESNNQDGIHVTGGRFISIANCVIASGDDCLSFTQDVNALEPLEDVSVSNCSVFGRGASCIKLDCNASSEETEWIRRINVTGVTGKGGDSAGVPIALRDETDSGKVEDITLDNVTLDCSENGSDGCTMTSLNRAVLRNVTIKNASARSFLISDCADSVMEGCKGIDPRGAGSPGIRWTGCTNGRIERCLMQGATGAGFQVQDCTDFQLLHNRDRGSAGTDFDTATGNTGLVTTDNVSVT